MSRTRKAEKDQAAKDKRNFLQRFGDAWAVFKAGNYWLGPGFNRGEGGGEGDKLDDPYSKSVWVMAAIGAVVRELTGLNLQFSTQRRQGKSLLEDPRLLQFWERPGVGMTRADFIEATGASFKLWGEFFWILDDSWLLRSTDPARRSKLLWANPKRMKHVVEEEVLTGWELDLGKGRKESLLPEQVIHVKRWDPNNRWRGLGELEAASLAAETDYLQGTFAKNLAANNGDRAPILVAKAGMPSEEQQKQIVKALQRKRRAAQNGSFEPAFLAGDIEQLEPTIQAPDAAYMAQRVGNRHEVFAAFGVPMSMADVQASYSIGSASDRFRLIEGTCMPLADRICDAVELVSARLLGQAPGTLYAWFDWMEHSVVRAVLKEFIESATGLWDRGMPWTEINAWLQLGLPRFAGDDVGYIDFNRVPVGELSDPVTSSDYAETSAPQEDTAEAEEGAEDVAPSDEKVLRMMLALRRRKASKARATQVEEPQMDADERGCCCAAEAQSAEERKVVVAFQKARDPGEVARWRSLMAKRRGTVRDYERKFRRALMSARREVLAKIEGARGEGRGTREFEFADDGLLMKRTGAAPMATRAAAVDLIFDKARWDAEFRALMEAAGRSALEAAAKQLLEEVGIDDPWTQPPHEVLSFLKVRENLLQGVADDVHQDIMDALSEGLDAGDTLDELAGRVKTAFNGISSNRARRIAQTETAAAYGKGRDIAMQQSGIEYKQWLTSGNDNVRAAHAAANGQTVPITEPFIVGGERLMWPGDSRGSAGNVINCHCVQIAVEGPEG